MRRRRKVWDGVLSLLFPHKCFLCGRVLPDTGWLCRSCVLPVAEGLCLHCGQSMQRCACQKGLSYDGACAPLWYQDGVRQGIHRFKYSGRYYYAPFLGALMAQCALENWGSIFDLITFAPMHPRKQRARGYCQSQLLAREVGERLGLPVKGMLRHTENSQAQMKQKTLAQRQENAQRSFMAGDEDLTGLRVLLVDDVLTTGSTASRCAELLKEQGAVSVHVLAAATAAVQKNAKTPMRNDSKAGF